MKVTKPQTYKTPNLDKLFAYMSDQAAYEAAKENIYNFISDAVIRSKELTASYISNYDIAEAILLDTTAFMNEHEYNKINGISLKDIVESLYNAMDEREDDNRIINYSSRVTVIQDDSSDDSLYYKKLFGTMLQKLHYDDQKNATSKNHNDKNDSNTKYNKTDSDNDSYDKFLNVVSDGFFNQVLKNFWDMNSSKFDSDSKKDAASKEHDGKNNCDANTKKSDTASNVHNDKNDSNTKYNKTDSAADSRSQALKDSWNPFASSMDGDSFNDIDSVFRTIFG